MTTIDVRIKCVTLRLTDSRDDSKKFEPKNLYDQSSLHGN